ncbi:MULTISPECIES: hypothetical protein [Streptomyces]|nr:MULTISPECIES: hypothetical protein [Streptomyces]UBI36934.1 hypothetical protein K7I03_10995 [Streptomyces mobaraensis]
MAPVPEAPADDTAALLTATERVDKLLTCTFTSNTPLGNTTSFVHR